MTRVRLVRHGQSFSNVEHRLSGVPPGPGLTPLGWRQAERAAQIVMEEGPPTRLFSSPLRRALETALPLRRRTGLPLAIQEDLRETGFGQWEGLDEAALRSLPGYVEWSRNPEASPPPGGERLSQVGARMWRCLTRLAQAHAGERLVAFSHHDAMLAFYLAVVGQAFTTYPPIAIPNACILEFVYDREWRYLGADRRAWEEPAEAAPGTA